MTLTVNLIGTGRVGRTLLRLLAGCPDVVVRSVSSRRLESARIAVDEAGAGVARALDAMRPADVWMLTVPDTQIAGVARDIAACGHPPSVAVHCSGYHRADEMAALGEAGWALASAHPMLSFASPEISARLFPGTAVGLEGDDAAMPAVQDMFERLGARCFRISSEGKGLYHAAAVITNNFTTVLQAVALEAWEAAGVAEDVARELNRTLLRSTLENLEKFGPAEALTGPAARGDAAVVEAQGREVAEWRGEAGELYDLLSRMAVRLKASGSALDDHDGPKPQ